jgi:hypothetical protein
MFHIFKKVYNFHLKFYAGITHYTSWEKCSSHKDSLFQAQNRKIATTSSVEKSFYYNSGRTKKVP